MKAAAKQIFIGIFGVRFKYPANSVNKKQNKV